MATNQLYVLYDKIAGQYSQPLSFVNQACAERYFVQLMAKQDNPTDYELYYLGEFDPELGLIYLGSDNSKKILCEPKFILKGVQGVEHNG